MKEVTVNYNDRGVPSQDLHHLERSLERRVRELKNIFDSKTYDSVFASINLSQDNDMLERVEHLAMQYRNIEAMVVVGIGGSNLGSLAIHEALHGRLYNVTNSPRVFFADTVDSQAMLTIASIVHAYLDDNHRVLIVIISKSGSTTETIANASILLDILSAKKIHHEKDVVCITDNGSALHELAKKNDYEVLEIPMKVGGRYSVFSAVGLFPLAVLNVDIRALLRGARFMTERCIVTDNNPALTSACIKYWHGRNGQRIVDTFIFGSERESIGKWYRQLLGESIGKEKNLAGNIVHAGLTPTVTIGSTDLHSVGQLALGGPADKFTIFITTKEQETLRVPAHTLTTLVPNVAGKTLAEIMNAIEHGTIKAYRDHARAFLIIHLTDISAYTLGQLLQLWMIETMYLAELFDVNAFDQPAVESYKHYTREALKRG